MNSLHGIDSLTKQHLECNIIYGKGKRKKKLKTKTKAYT